ncbi:hypothetical protein JZO70_01685 [Enterococcus sp. 669A]|uniref:Phage protein n=1 Tax=Candidatus Enterococcus moelleringii TaxID=2815325 RepID=A0ABS3L5F7_9ENTE|nr:hypothetical protein [Enterococcus sp. 669A]MBO1304856.1 hypothetical protein [Enterococcus sp. 669A]
MKYYDITFHQSNGHSIVKRAIPSEKEGFEAWQDAVVSYDEKELHILVNDGTYAVLNRAFIVSITAEEVVDPVDQEIKQHGELRDVINTLSNMGF